jgi:hypothetical protein
MADPIWTDGVTPLNAVNMTKLQTRDERNAPSGYVGLDAGRSITIPGYVALTQASVGVAFAAAVTGDSANRYLVDTNGKINWGLGSTAADTNLYRAAAGVLRTDGALQAGFNGASALSLYAPSAGVTLGGDTNLYRSAAGTLKTDGVFQAGQHAISYVGTQYEVYLGPTGGGNAAIQFHSSHDTNLYRSAAGT